MIDQAAPHPRDLEEAMQAASEKTKTFRGVTVREKCWSELSIEEKLERTRQQVKQLAHLWEELARLGQQLEALKSQFQAHAHGANDQVMVPCWVPPGRDFANGSGKCLEPSDPDKVYF